MIRPISERRRLRNQEAAPVRRCLLAKHRSCMLCGHSPRRPWRDKPLDCSELCVHEIANGVNRQKALDKPFACLVVCWYCNCGPLMDNKEWPESRQLAVLLIQAIEDYDLKAYNNLVNPRAPNRITSEEVKVWLKES